MVIMTVAVKDRILFMKNSTRIAALREVMNIYRGSKKARTTWPFFLCMDIIIDELISPLFVDIVNDAVFLRFLCIKEEIAIGILFNL